MMLIGMLQPSVHQLQPLAFHYLLKQITSEIKSLGIQEFSLQESCKIHPQDVTQLQHAKSTVSFQK